MEVIRRRLKKNAAGETVRAAQPKSDVNSIAYLLDAERDQEVRIVQYEKHLNELPEIDCTDFKRLHLFAMKEFLKAIQLQIKLVGHEVGYN